MLYSKIQKSLIKDTQGVDWEAFYAYESAAVYEEGFNAKPGTRSNGTMGLVMMESKL